MKQSAEAMDFELLPAVRERIVNKIMETLVRCLPVSGQLALQELNKIAVRFEEKVYTSATNQDDYLRKISLKMLTMEKQSLNPMTNSIQPNATSSGQNAHGPEMMTEATSDETASELEETDNEQATEEDDEDVSEEDGVEDAAVMKEKTSVAGHNENVTVTENEVKDTCARERPMMGSRWQGIASGFDRLDGCSDGLVSRRNGFGISGIATSGSASLSSYLHGLSSGAKLDEPLPQVAASGFARFRSHLPGLSSGAKLDERLAKVEKRMEKIEAHSEKLEILLVDINKKLNYLVMIQDIKVCTDVRRPAEYMSSSWICDDLPKRIHRVGEMIRRFCRYIGSSFSSSFM